MATKASTVTLIVLDGWGLAPADEWNAVAAADTPTFDQIWNDCPHTQLDASGEAVGLPEGQMGNSEVGHTNLGAGRVVYQPSARITKSIRDGDFFDNPALVEAMKQGKANRLHLLGLVSDGGVHSDLNHLLALLDMAKRRGVEHVYVHAFTDGRDTRPKNGAGYLETVQAKLGELGFKTGAIATVTGRYYAMDRDKRWERTEKAYRALRHGQGHAHDGPPAEAARCAYGRGQTDEFVEPIVCDPAGIIRDGDAAVFFNFRPDRARQLTRAFIQNDFDGFERDGRPGVHFVGMTQYESHFDFPVAFPPEGTLEDILGQVLSDAGLKQFRCAETEKYAHVTYFFNNGREDPFAGEEQQLIPSPKVATYDLQPEMSAPQVAAETAERVRSGRYAFALVNFANPDMVGHTGDFDAAVKAVEATDAALGRVLEAVREAGGEALVIADHGNADRMVQDDGSPHTAHTTNPVPCVYVGPRSLSLDDGGALCDMAPTALALLGLAQPEAMTGRSLARFGV